MAIARKLKHPHYLELVCSCGYHKMIPMTSSEEAIAVKCCPQCKTTDMNFRYTGSYGFASMEKTIPEIDVTVISHCAFILHVTRYRFTVDNGYNKRDGDPRMELEYLNEADIDVDITRPDKAVLTINGKPVPPNKSNLSKALAYVTTSSVPNTVFSSIGQAMSTTSLSQVLQFLLKYPFFEKFFEKDPKMYSYCYLHEYIRLMNITAAKPHQILGLTKPEYERYIVHIKKFYDGGLAYPVLLQLKKRMTEANLLQMLELTWELACRDPHNCVPRGWVELICAEYVNYDLDTLFDYLTDKLYTYQGISSVRDGAQLLADYQSLCHLMDVTAEKYPKSLKLRHDLASKNYQVVLKEEQIKRFHEVVSCSEYQKLAYTGEHYSVVIPQEPNDIVYEGSFLGHCVGSYVEKINQHGVKIAFLRTTGKEQTPLVTLDVRDKVLTQAAGAGNRSLFKEEAAFVREWAKAKHLEIGTTL